MKNFSKIFLIFMALCLLLVGCKDKQEEETPNLPIDDVNDSSNPIYENFPMDEALSEMESLLDGIELNRLSEEEIEEKYQFGEYKNLKKIVASNETEDGISEIAIVRLDDMEQSTDILFKFVDRRENLKEQYADKEEVLEMLSKQDGVIMKQQQGIVVMIIGDNSKELEEQFDKNLRQ